MTKLNEKIFKAYDVRGLYPEEINEESARSIAKAFVKFLNAKSVVVGHDMRESSEVLHSAFIGGLVDMGITVYDIGLSSTPMLYFAPTFLKAEGAVMVTASHNPMNYGGLKFTDKKGAPIFKENGLLQIKKLALEDIDSISTKGEVEKVNIENDYAKYLKETYKEFENIKVVIDAMHGSMGPMVKKAFEGSKLDISFISCDPDPEIPGYKTPNPSLEENRKNIKEAILETRSDIGILFDGDGDRMVAVDSNGDLVSPNFIASLIAGELLEKNKGITIVGDVRASHSIRDLVEEKGGKYCVAVAGNPYIKEKMIEVDAFFGFETTGHMMFKKSNYAEDTITGVTHLLNALAHSDKNPQEVLDQLKERYHIADEVNYKIDDESVLDKTEAKYEDGRIEKLDGLTVEFEDYWFNIRKSNTEPLIRLNMEADSKEILEAKQKEFTGFIKSLGGEIADH